MPIAYLNDFIFCPRSIYFHQLFAGYRHQYYKRKAQVAGTEAHARIDGKKYSSRKDTFMAMEVYSEKYGLCGKIDLYDKTNGRLTERKNEVKTIYDGYVFQVYAQCHALREMGYIVKSIVIYDMKHNKNHPIKLPEEDPEMQEKFETVVQQINSYDLEKDETEPNVNKCLHCIYSKLCDRALT